MSIVLIPPWTSSSCHHRPSHCRRCRGSSPRCWWCAAQRRTGPSGWCVPGTSGSLWVSSSPAPLHPQAMSVSISSPLSATQDYEPTIFYPKRSPDPLYQDFTTQCEKMDIPFLSYLPTEVQLINDAYNAVVDAVLGAEAEAAEGREPCAAILSTLKLIRIPIVSLDVPSGWDVEAGSSGGISPDVLVSLSAPKQCARRFLGRQHFVAGRFLPYDVQKKFELNPPEYPGTECVVALRAPRQ
uniref:YjeF N-terminal domain-containing protein n=1 Tax=Amazona collaria TaxID=241587 RepID=A0A8B9F416_9PSIT